MFEVRILSRTRERAARDFLNRFPYENVFLDWLIATDRSAITRAALYECVDESGALRGVAYFARQVALAADSDSATDALAAHGALHAGARMIVGRRSTVQRYWARVRGTHPAPRIIRDRQPLLRVEAATLHGSEDDVRVRQAEASDVPAVAQNSAAMITNELGYDPRERDGAFSANVRRMIERGLWWVGERRGELCFFCHEGPVNDSTLQLQGIWTPPELRGRGLAAASLFSIARTLLERVPSISLYVNSDNRRALRLYSRLAFTKVGELSTILLP